MRSVMPTKILIIDDDKDLLDVLRRILEAQEFEVFTLADGAKAVSFALEILPALIILDIMMPDVDGAKVLRKLKDEPSLTNIPVIFFSGKSSSADIAEGLDSGADDYVVKPLDILELPARVRAVLRRAYGSGDTHAVDFLVYGNISLRVNSFELTLGDSVVQLTSIEHKILYHLLEAQGKPVPIDNLLQAIWDYPPKVGDPNLVRVHISNLRHKLRSYVDRKPLIQNIYGKGYFIRLV